MNVPLLNEIERDLETVTDHELELARKKLEPVGPDEKVLGPIDSRMVRTLHALAWRYARAGSLQKHTAEYDTLDEALEKELTVKADRLLVLGYCVRLLAHYTAILELGEIALAAEMAEDVHLHMRAGWQLVSHKQINPRELLGRAFRIPTGPEGPDQ